MEDFNVEELKTLTRAADGHWMKFATASTKAIRGEHAGDVHKRMGGRAHGGIVILDEEAEMDEDVVKAGLKTVRTARPPVIVRSSTLHRTEGTFGQLVDDPMGRGYRLYEWDTFDVSEMCRRSCKRCIPEFREKYCMGKAKKHRPGWVPIVNIIQDWEGRLSDEDFEVECMGWRPSSEG